MKVWGSVVGTIMAVGLGVAFPVALSALPDTPDLQVTVPGARPFVVRDEARQPGPVLALLPSPEPEGISSSLSSSGPGLALRTWEVTYSHRWERDVALPILTGPFARDGEDICGISVRLGAGLFDTRGAGAGFEGVIKKRAASFFGREMDVAGHAFALPALDAVHLWIVPRPNTLTVHIELRLVDGTIFAASFDARIDVENGTPVVRRVGEPVTTWSGPTRDRVIAMGATEGTGYGVAIGLLGCFFGPLGCVAGVGVGAAAGDNVGRAKANDLAESTSKELIAKGLDDALAEVGLKLNALGEPWAPFPARPKDVVRFRLSGAPRVTSSGIALDLCTRVTIGDTPVDRTIPGSLFTMAALPMFDRAPASSDLVELAVNGDALNQLLYFMWQSGRLRDLGTSRGLLDSLSLPPEMSALAFDFKGFDAGLPPSVIEGTAKANTLQVGVADVKIGDWGNRRVVAHGFGSLRLESIKGRITLSAAVDRLVANCTERVGTGTALTPCVSDLMPTVRERLSLHPLEADVEGGELLAKLPTTSFGGADVHLSDLRATVGTGPIRLGLQVHAKVVGGK